MTKLSEILVQSMLESVNETSEYYHDCDEEEIQSIHLFYVCSTYVLLAFSVATITYGVISWSLIKKFRNISNYVFLNASFANAIRLIFVSITKLHRKTDIYDPITSMFFYYISMVYQYLIVIMLYLFYVQIVKVYHKDITRKFLKASLFAWGAPILLMIACCIIFAITIVFLGNPSETFIKIFIPFVLILTCDVLPAIINTAIFVKVTWSLFGNQTPDATVVSESASKKVTLRRLLLATAVYVSSNLIVFSFPFWILFKLPIALRVVALSLQTVIVSLFVLFWRSNRDFWREYLKNRVPRTLP